MFLVSWLACPTEKCLQGSITGIIDSFLHIVVEELKAEYTMATKAPADSPAKDPATPKADEATKGPPSAIEFEPPLACVRRILKNSLPSSTNVGKDASAAFARASGIFIIYLTACANDFARENRRQTITANDVMAAIKVSFGLCFGRGYSFSFSWI